MINDIYTQQQQAKVLLYKVDEILRENKFKYSLAYGSVLGAVRHHGFIPWDTDIDICVGMDDYEAILESLKKNLPGNMMLLCKEDNESYEEVVTRVCYKGVRHQDIHVDIFIYAGCPENNIAKNMFWLACYLTNRAILMKNVNPKVNYKNKRSRFYASYIFKLFLLPIPSKILTLTYKKLGKLYSTKGANKLFVINSVGKAFYERKYFDQLALTKFEDKELPIPEDYDGYLTMIYGNYMVPIKY